MPSIGQRRERVTIREALTTDDGMGGQALVRWRTVAEPWAQVTGVDERQRERQDAGQIQGRQSYLVTIPYRAGLTADLQMIVRDTTMQIHSVTDMDGRRRSLLVQVVEAQR